MDLLKDVALWALVGLFLGAGAYRLVLTLVLRKIRFMILDFPRLDHQEVFQSRLEQQAVPEGFESWGWVKEEIPTPWRGDLTLEYAPGREGARTAVFVHGTSTNRFSMVRYLQPYRELGFNLVLYDHPGHGIRKDPPPSYGWYEKGELDFLVDHLRDVFPGTTLWAFHGESLGAGVIMDYLGSYPCRRGETRVGILDCGYTDFSQVVDHHLTRWHLPPGLRRWALEKTAGLMLRRSLAPLERLKPGEAVLKSPDPLLLIHGLEDIRVPPSMSRKLWQDRKDRAYTELHEVPGARHCKSWSAGPKDYDSWVRNFLLNQGGCHGGS